MAAAIRNRQQPEAKEWETSTSALDLAPSLVELFRGAAERGGEQPFLWAKREGTYSPWSWRRVADEVRLLSRALRAGGLSPGDRMLIVAENRPEWAIADLAVLAAGGISVPAYTTNTSADHSYLLGHSEAAGVILSGARQAERVFPAIRETGRVRLVIAMDQDVPGPGLAGVPLLTWGEAMALGERERGADDVQIGPEHTACLIYTSGTGGAPKGVMLSHRNLLANVAGARRVLETIGLGDDVFLSFLPLSHAYEHTAGQFLPIAVGAQIYYAEGLETVSTNLVEVRPTIMACVPRFYEVLRQRMLNTVARQGKWQARLFHKAVELGSRAYERPGSLTWRERVMDRALDRLVRARVRARFGGRMKALVSGGAPLNYEVGLFFTALGLPLLQGYGQTECAPVISVNLPEKVKLHTVGPPLPGLEVRIAADGEILVRGESVMQGYWRDAEATRRALREGWLHTGDIGVIDEDGFIQITDRKRDIIVNSGGDNIAPQRVEGILLLQPEIGQAIVYGDRRPHLVALIVPQPELLKRLARNPRPDDSPLLTDPKLQEVIGAAVQRANRQLSVIERVRRFGVMAAPFTIESGMMTPTLKLKRQKIYRAYQPLFEALYEGQRRA